MCWDDWLPKYPLPVQTLVVSTKAGREGTVYSAKFMGSWTIPHREVILAELITNNNNLSEPELCTIIVLSSIVGHSSYPNDWEQTACELIAYFFNLVTLNVHTIDKLM